MRKVFLIMLVLVFACGTAFASVGVRDQGVRTDSAMDLNFTGDVDIVNPNTAVQEVKIGERVEVLDTYTVLTLSQSGTTIVATGTTAIGVTSRTFRLPDITTSTDDGVFFTFVNGTHSGASAPGMNIDPGEDDTIFLTGIMTDDESITAGIGPDSYPSITLRAASGNWYVESVGVGTWTSGG